MRIVQIYKDYFPVLGGIENHVRQLSEGLAARGHMVTVLTTSRTRQTEIANTAPRLTVVKAARDLQLASTPISFAMFARARRLRADLIHLHFPYPPADLAALLMPHETPVVVTYHSDIVRQRTLLRVYRPLMALTLRRAARLIATSPHYLASSPFLRPHAARCAIVPLAVDVDRFAEADQQRVAELRAAHPGRLLLFVGRLRYYKGLHILLDALQSVDATLLIVGSGPERERLAAQAAQLGISERVRFLGDLPDEDLPIAYHAADLFVLPAHLRAEALGLAQIEAMASGTACISTELGTGTSFANLHGATGLVVPASDSAALAQAINTLLADPVLRQQMGTAGRQRARELFSVSRMLDAIEGVYRDAIAAA